MRVGSVAAGAGRQCAPAAPIGRFARPLNFTVRQREEFRATVQLLCRFIGSSELAACWYRLAT